MVLGLLVIIRTGLLFTNNVEAISSLNGLIEKTAPQTPCTGIPALPYPNVIWCVKKFEATNSTEAGFTFLEGQMAAFPTRRAILVNFQAELAGVSDQPEVACKLVTDIDNVALLVNLASRAEKLAKWQDLAEYMTCFERWGSAHGGVSVFTIATLYFSLGRYSYRDQKDLTAAKRFFESAAKWYPTVWADPVIMLAEIDKQEQGVVAAVQRLLAALKVATLPQSVFLLSRQIGLYEEQLGNESAAFCFYLRARETGKALEEAYAPRSWLLEIDKRLMQLTDLGFGDLSKCQ